MTGIQPTMLRPAPSRPTWQTVLGFVLALPAFVLLLLTYVEPTIWTIRSSFSSFTGVRFAPAGSSSGFDNYSRAFDAGLGGDILFALSLAGPQLALVLVLAPALAWAASRAGRIGRWSTRAVLTIPLAACAPMAIALALRVSYFEDAPSARASYWLGTFGFVVATSTLLYLAAFRSRRPVAPLTLAAVILVLGILSAALQEFTYTFMAGYGGRTDQTPATTAILQSMAALRFGEATAVSVVMLIPLIVFGAVVTVLVARSGLRLEVDARPADTPARSAAPWTVSGILLFVVLAVTLTALWPWLSNITNEPPSSHPTGVNTWIPPLISTVVGVTVAALAAFGISALRPLGRHSEWLLLPFGLFLFVGVGPLALRAFAAGQTAARLNTFLALIPPSRVAIPALFVLALLFRGQALRRETLLQEGRPAPWSSLILPALPMLALTYVVTWLLQAQNLLWPYITSAVPDHMTAHIELIRVLQTLDTEHLPYGKLLPLPALIVLLLAGVAAQLLYLDRVALRAGLPERDHPPRT
ncbi:sugar ABC transporter permease [Dactylosporangium sp. AC04546]|uniref:sugar ABC transporter permease n=1 Tax=Dactylosporangium sp. AC04546 TaxID=2862460 RepID=UPI001EDE0E55|nr:sugar ABC transporter permease [Dactylosporangium sp. AC04546]WVK83583.1 sugar ABC transporter permease [Dactylosporangium sp. AC04546]